MARRQFLVGDPVPDFHCAATVNPNFSFGSVAGRYIVLCFYGSASIEKNAKAIEFLTTKMRHHFNDEKISLFGICIDKSDQERARVKDIYPGIRYFWDFDHKISQLYGAMDEHSVSDTGVISYTPFTLVVDPSLRVVGNIPLSDLEKHNQTFETLINTLPPADEHAGVTMNAPVLIIPRVFEPDFCKQLISLYEAGGAKESGSMIEKDGKTVGKIDYNFKRRMDCDITDPQIQEGLRARVKRRIVPEIQKAFQFNVSRIERYIVACYDSEHQGFFRAHRDNTTKGTAHRRFACTINLNAEDYDGGNLRFPEFGNRTYRAPTGGAVVFSCSMLHEATPVTRGKRYATLPFLYDETAAKIRADNLEFLTGEVLNLNAGQIAPAGQPTQIDGVKTLSSL